MQITSSNLALAAVHQESRTVSATLHVKAWVGDGAAEQVTGQPGAAPPAGAPANGPAPGGAGLALELSLTQVETQASLSATAASRSATGAAAGGAPSQGSVGADDPQTDRRLLDLLLILETLSQKRGGGGSAQDAAAALASVDQLRAELSAGDTGQGAVAPAPAAAPQGPGFSVDLQQVQTESETTAFSATGTVTTADGKTLQIDLSQVEQRTETQVSELQIQGGAPQKKVDPLVLSLDGKGPAFDGTQSFDLTGSGQPQTIARLAPGAAYLALDRNGNGKIDSGTELFGPTSGSGFSELRAYDQNHDGWIDASDPVFARLALYAPGGAGGEGTLTPLSAAGIGALYLGSARTPFQVDGSAGKPVAQVQESGLFLREDGTAGALQHVDLVV